MTKLFSLAIPALVLAFATMHSTDAEARRHVAVVTPAKIAPGALFLPGHWEVRKGKRVWVKAQVRLVPTGRSAYVPGRWEMRAGRRIWIAGHWK